MLHRCVRRCISEWPVCAEAALSLGLATTALPVDEQALLDMMAGASAGVLESAGPRNYLTDKVRLDCPGRRPCNVLGSRDIWSAVQDAAGSVPLTPVNHSAFESLGRRLAETCGQVAGGWGQCGGQSNCPAGAPCGDRDWYPSVCCPIVHNTAQAGLLPTPASFHNCTLPCTPT